MQVAVTCGARTRGGGSCKGLPMENGRCRMHGGASLRGIAHPGFVDGSRSRYRLSPGTLADDYSAGLQDLDYIALRDEIALISAQVQALIDEEPAAEACERCASISKQERLSDLVDLRRKLADTEAKRIKMAADTLTGEQIRTLAQATLAANRRRAQQYLQPERVADFLSDVQADVRSIVQSIREGTA